MKVSIPKVYLPLIGMIIIMGLVEYFSPKPTDWTVSYEFNDKRPYGSFLIQDLFEKEIFPDQALELIDVPIYNYPKDQEELKNYLFISSQFSLAKYEIKHFFDLVEKGNTVFLATSNLSKLLADTLGVHIKSTYFPNIFEKRVHTSYFEDQRINRAQGFIFKKAFEEKYIEIDHADQVEVLSRDTAGIAEMVRIPMGKGCILLSCQPLAFTNYGALHNSSYLAGAMSYLPYQRLVFDNYYKPLRESRKQSPFSFILKNPPLRFAFYLILALFVLMLIFQGKRKQRVMPIINTLPNTSLNFVRTLGGLYFDSKNHRNIAQKKYTHFKDFILTKYHINFDEANLQHLSLRMGVQLILLSDLFFEAGEIERKKLLTAKELSAFDKKVEYIYKNCK